MIILKKRWYNDDASKYTPIRMVISTGKRLKMVSGSFYIPKLNDLRPLGEDDHFNCDEQRTIGVADGVGGWSRQGVDPGKYARELMTNSVYAIHQQPNQDIDPKKVLKQAFLNTEAEGSSTACIVTVTGDDTLRAANVGDSGFLLIRDGLVVYQSPVQQHAFNCPFQLGKLNDSPKLAEEIRVPVAAGDVIVAGTDGLFDNLHIGVIVEIVRQGLEGGENPNQIAWTIAEFSHNASNNKFFLSPFAIAAVEAGYEGYLGGKVDDITVIVAFLTAEEN